MAILLITHDLGVMSEVCEVVNVIFSGQIVEKGPKEALLNNPAHPYTQSLMDSIPENFKLENSKKGCFSIIDNQQVNTRGNATGCCYYQRCYKAQELCKIKKPELKIIDENREVACFFIG